MLNYSELDVLNPDLVSAKFNLILYIIFQFETPCPTEYQQHCTDLKTFELDQKPFLVGADRFPVYKRDIVDVLPG